MYLRIYGGDKHEHAKYLLSQSVSRLWCIHRKVVFAKANATCFTAVT